MRLREARCRVLPLHDASSLKSPLPPCPIKIGRVLRKVSSDLRNDDRWRLPGTDQRASCSLERAGSPKVLCEKSIRLIPGPTNRADSDVRISGTYRPSPRAAIRSSSIATPPSFLNRRPPVDVASDILTDRYLFVGSTFVKIRSTVPACQFHHHGFQSFRIKLGAIRHAQTRQLHVALLQRRNSWHGLLKS